ncbi:hypothetical protein NBRC10512_005913 [Rhodotorula toruloides]|uniref:Uncharacterized protein n=1 Tax=Rhodotorula toruloides (strain NP11) TaxID=1130832 RepID=M7XPM9_RHOT1|nr:uncharacterized protein RHTO_00922 [Rhodotorula toruloides NP11]EMS22168.1 hypothetical protein RHTO_00922 [Rhodotorula toruloides NP11]
MDRRPPRPSAPSTSRALRGPGVATGAKRRAGGGDENQADPNEKKRQRTEVPSSSAQSSSSTATRRPLRQLAIFPARTSPSSSSVLPLADSLHIPETEYNQCKTACQARDMASFEETVQQYIGTVHTRHAFLHDNCIVATLGDEPPQPEDSPPFCADAGELIALIPFLLMGYQNLSSLVDDAADKYILARQENYKLWRIGLEGELVKKMNSQKLMIPQGQRLGDLLHALRSQPLDRLVFPPWLLALASSIVYFLRPDARTVRNLIGHPPTTGSTLNSSVQRFFPSSLSRKRRQDLLCDVIKASVLSKERRTELLGEVQTLDRVESTAANIPLPQPGQLRLPPRTIVQHQAEERRVWEFWHKAWQDGVFPAYREDSKEAIAQRHHSYLNLRLLLATPLVLLPLSSFLHPSPSSAFFHDALPPPSLPHLLCLVPPSPALLLTLVMPDDFLYSSRLHHLYPSAPFFAALVLSGDLSMFICAPIPSLV